MLDKNLMAIHLTDCDDEEARIVALSGANMSVVAGKIVMKGSASGPKRSSSPSTEPMRNSCGKESSKKIDHLY